MCFLANLLELVGVLAASSALVACTGDIGGGPDGAAPGPAPPSLGAAKERLNGSGWKILRSGDFNFDRMSDVLWNDPGTNTMAVWLMSGTHLLLPGPVIPGPIGAGWRVVKAADFNADGMADVIWSNSGSGSAAVWLMSGTQLLLPGPVIPGPIGAGWSVAYAADFNADGMSDAIWQNTTTNRMAVWLMGGTNLLLPGPEIPGPADIGP
jgi:hypothetical protein